MTRSSRLFVLICLFPLTGFLSAATISPEVEQRIATLTDEERIPVIINFAEKVDLSCFSGGRSTAGEMIIALRENAKRNQIRVMGYFQSIGRGDEVRSFWVSNSMAVEITTPVLEKLAGFPEVESIVLDEHGHFPEPQRGSRPAPDFIWNLEIVRVDEVWETHGLDGSGIVIGSMDSGFDPDHPAIAGKWRGGDNSWFDPVNGLPDPHDGYGHGTHTIGILVGGDGSGPFTPDIGLASGAKFIAARMCEDDGSYVLSDFFECAQWMLDPDGDPLTDDFPHVISNSWGMWETWEGFYSSIEVWQAAGIIPVFAIGNSGPNPATTMAPGNYDNVIGVGATTMSDDIAVFSSRGPGPEGEFWPEDKRKPDLSAPGEWVYSCVPGGGYEHWAGTSMACPHVAATVALMLQADPSMGYDEIRDLLLGSAIDRGVPGYDFDFGYGRLDVHSAVTLLTGSGLIATGPGSGVDNPTTVRLFHVSDPGLPLVQWDAYGVSRYGVNVALGDLNGDGYPEVVTGPGPGAVFGPHVRGFQRSGTPIPEISFLAYGTNRWGVNVACGDLDGDGREEIVTGAGPGPDFGPLVRGWNWDGTGVVAPLAGVSFLAYGSHHWGVNVACGDLDGDGYDEMVTGAGPGHNFGTHVRGWNWDGSGTVTQIPGVSYFAYETNKCGVNVAAGDIDGDGFDEIITGQGPRVDLLTHLRGWNFDGTGTVQLIEEIDSIVFSSGGFLSTQWGLNVGCGDLDGDGIDEILTGAGPGLQFPAWVCGFNFDGVALTEIPGLVFTAYDSPEVNCGVNVCGE